MEFNPINLAGGILVALMLVPNVLYALRFPGAENQCKSKAANFLEQLGRCGSMALMVFPFGVWEFGFSSVEAMLAYAVGNAALLIAYYGFWALYFHRQTRLRAVALAVIPTGIFLLSGVTLGHPLLVLAAAIFGGAHLF